MKSIGADAMIKIGDIFEHYIFHDHVLVVDLDPMSLDHVVMVFGPEEQRRKHFFVCPYFSKDMVKSPERFSSVWIRRS